jgi:hypothetical protein
VESAEDSVGEEIKEFVNDAPAAIVQAVPAPIAFAAPPVHTHIAFAAPVSEVSESDDAAIAPISGV